MTTPKLEPTSYALQLPHESDYAPAVDVTLDRIMNPGGTQLWKAHTMVPVGDADPVAALKLLARRLRELAALVERATLYNHHLDLLEDEAASK